MKWHSRVIVHCKLFSNFNCVSVEKNPERFSNAIIISRGAQMISQIFFKYLVLFHHEFCLRVKILIGYKSCFGSVLHLYHNHYVYSVSTNHSWTLSCFGISGFWKMKNMFLSQQYQHVLNRLYLKAFTWWKKYVFLHWFSSAKTTSFVSRFGELRFI